jgi:4-hydroxythreonine-4-phosphate dehydrogenase
VHSPRLLLTLGDVAGIGPEIVARGWPELCKRGVPVVVGDIGSMQRALKAIGSTAELQEIGRVIEANPSPTRVPVLQSTGQDLRGVAMGKVSAAAGQAAYDFLCRAIDLTLAGEADAIVTGPLHKEGLKAAGLSYPGHTEILAERTGAARHAMLLWGGNIAVAHVTLHMALHNVFANLTTAAVIDTARVLADLLPRLIDRKPRIGIAALNPHASDGGLFGDEEKRLISPAVDAAKNQGLDVSGPWPSDTLFVRARRGEFDGIVAMYHDQGHIPMKLLCGWNLVNITAGLPIVRTSVAHGTAYDIAGQGKADAGSLIVATDAACRLAVNLQGVNRK